MTLTVTTAVADAVDPVYDSEWTSAGVASTLVGVTVLMFAALAYFVGQRDRYQQESDDLLHNILPEQIAARLKADSSMIADGVDDASVLFRFADIVGFTSQSAQHSPERIVRMLDSVSTGSTRWWTTHLSARTQHRPTWPSGPTRICSTNAGSASRSSRRYEPASRPPRAAPSSKSTEYAKTPPASSLAMAG